LPENEGRIAGPILVIAIEREMNTWWRRRTC
jgi:hypothetical protein